MWLERETKRESEATANAPEKEPDPSKALYFYCFVAIGKISPGHREARELLDSGALPSQFSTNYASRNPQMCLSPGSPNGSSSKRKSQRKPPSLFLRFRGGSGKMGGGGGIWAPCHRTASCSEHASLAKKKPTEQATSPRSCPEESGGLVVLF